MPLLVIYNPVCGDRSAKPFFQEHVLPLLTDKGKNVDLTVETTHEGHAGQVVSEFLHGTTSEEPLSVVIGSGDGTVNEVVNELFKDRSGSATVRRIHIALVPCGTANALYSSLFPVPSGEAAAKDVDYRLQSVRAFVSGERKRVPLSLAATELKSPASSEGGTDTVTKTIVSVVVTSTSLHAAILHSSEALRAEHPGLERFKIAAQQNSTKWFKARVRLLPTLRNNTAPEIYDSGSKSFVPASVEGGIVELQGPFAYFLSTINVDRLEPTFRITPLSHSIPPPPNTCDIVVIRPLRDPTLSEDDAAAREQFVAKTWAAMMAAYQEGAHVDLRYDEKGAIAPGGQGENLIEYYRCGGWEWHPDPSDEDARLVCSDGAINVIEPNGWAECRASTSSEDRPTFEIYVA
ncbi:hypothetical protein H1R20_g409, partial [Candolleomyces eurysporus]